MNMNLLTADNLHLWRGDLHVLRGLTFGLPAGHCLQIMGPNGSGKSSLLRALCGLLPLEAGRIAWREADVYRDLLAFQRELAYLGHSAGLKGDLTSLENLRFAVGLRRVVADSVILQLLEQMGIASRTRERLVRHLSAGQLRRVALARVLLSQCPLWILDEPNSNLDVGGQRLLGERLQQHLEGGGCAVIATHQQLPLDPARQLLLELN